jgi:hypothetical protein
MHECLHNYRLLVVVRFSEAHARMMKTNLATVAGGFHYATAAIIIVPV